MKSWADHCSSDEESIDGLADELKAQKFADAAPSADGVEGGEAGAEESFAPAVVGGDAPPAGPRVYDFPDKPPFTAFIGNLAYSLKDPEELKAAVAKCALDNLGQEINILGARISFGRDGKHRGFGYLELETLDQLKTLMQLNDGEGTVAGRKVQLDTANGKTRDNNNNKRGGSHQQRRNHGDGGNIDGSRFRGGKFNNSDRRNNGNSGGGPAPPGERPSLKLAPRTKKVEDAIDGQGSANIFGGAKARDAQAWEEKRGPKKHRENNGEQNKDNNDRRRSQGGRGRGAAEGGRGRGAAEGGRGRSSGSGRGGAKGETNGGRRGAQAAKRQAQQNMVPPEERAAAAAAKAAAEAAAAPAAPAKPQVPANKFALLMDSDSE